jgi:hypothetical protein
MSTSKKVRRVRRPQPAPLRQPIEFKTNPTTKVSTPQKPQFSSTEEELREEYAYVLQDLRRVFILAAAMFVLLIIINVFLS